MNEQAAQKFPVLQTVYLICAVFFLFSIPAHSKNARGLDNPLLAINLSDVRDWSPGLQFIDIMKLARPFVAVSQKKSLPWLQNQELRIRGFLDPKGWPLRIPDEYDYIQTFWQWNSLPEQADIVRGRYLLRYDGRGKIRLKGKGLTVLSETPGEIWLNLEDSQTFFLRIVETDPENTGDHLRNITLVAEKNLDLHTLGAVFNPDWLRLIEDVRQIRFMNWEQTNNSSVVGWTDRTHRGDASTFTVPLEDMVQLANEIGAEPWFTLPHLADETHIRNFATYVRDYLDPRLPIRVEYSNEVWNWRFRQAKWVARQSVETWGKDKHIAYHTKKAVETALIWDDVFGSAAETRLVHVLGTQAVNTWRSKTMLEARQWRRHEPNTFVDPKTVFDELAITHYFGGHTMRDKLAQAELLFAIKTPEINATALLAARLRDSEYPSSLLVRAQQWREHAELAHAYGLRIVAYEGGQHVHHHGRGEDLSEEDRDLLTEFLTEFVRSPEMATLYEDSWRLWAEIADGPFMQFGDIRKPNKYGLWSMYESLLESTLRADVLQTLNHSEIPWWDTTPNPAFLQGVTEQGTNDADNMTGTVEEDYLLARAGDDHIRETLGNDGVHGGPGEDTVELKFPREEYKFQAYKGGALVHGPQGRDFYLSIEGIIFGDGKKNKLKELIGD